MGSSTNALKKDGALPDSAASLSAVQRQVLELLVDVRELPYPGLCQKALSASLTQQEIDAALYALVQAGYLLTFVEDNDVIYMLNQRVMGKAKSKPLKHDEMAHVPRPVLPNKTSTSKLNKKPSSGIS